MSTVNSLQRENPFNKITGATNFLYEDNLGLFQEAGSLTDDPIPVIECNTAQLDDSHDTYQTEGGSIFNRLLRPLTPSDTLRTPLAESRPRLVIRDVDDDDDELLCPDQTPILQADSSDDAIPLNKLHCHAPLPLSPEKRKAKIQLIITSSLCFLFMIGEIIGGIIANSLALQTDAAHLATDLIAFLVSLFALWASSKPATKKLSFGFHRIEVLGALFSIVLIWGLTAFLVYMAIQRVVNRDYEIDSDAMLVTAGCGVAFNIVMCIVLHADICASEMGSILKHGHSHGGDGHHGHSHNQSHTSSHASPAHQSRWRWLPGNRNQDVGHILYHDLESSEESESPSFTPRSHLRETPDLVDNLPETAIVNRQELQLDSNSAQNSPLKPKRNINVRAAIIHVIGDLIQSIGVLIAAYIIKYKPSDAFLIADPICTFVFSVLVLASTFTVARDVFSVLMEATPKDIDYNLLKADLESVAGVKTAHSLHVWCLTLDKYALAVHLGVRSSRKQTVLNQASSMLQQKYGIHHTTIQVEDFEADLMDSCSRCIGPQK